MAESRQSFANHTHFRPFYHLSTLPILVINAIVFIVLAVREPGRMSIWLAVVSVAVVAYMLDNRVAMLTIQDRLIRLETRVRLEQVLGAGAREKIAKLTLGQLVGLRFASDAELPGLVERALAGELRGRRAVKREVRDWQSDTMRA
jgi:hypothetical protein